MMSASARADENGVSFWLPGTFGSFAAATQTPGWSGAFTYYHASWAAGSEVARSNEIRIGRIPVNVSATVNGGLDTWGDLFMGTANYVFDTPVLGGQASAGLTGLFGRVATNLGASVTGNIAAPLGFGLAFFGNEQLADAVWGLGDLYPMLSLRWNFDNHSVMTYVTGDIPTGSYSATSLANIGIGHGAIDVGGAYTYLNTQTGQEASGTLGFTYNFANNATQYQNGVDMHFDFGAAQFFNEHLFFGPVGYIYQQIGCDQGAAPALGCFQSRVFGAGPQIGLLVPVGKNQGYVNFRGYKEFGAQNRPEGWNVRLTFAISGPPPPMPTK
jgi:hypothetical protein